MENNGLKTAETRCGRDNRSSFFRRRRRPLGGAPSLPLSRSRHPRGYVRKVALDQSEARKQTKMAAV